MASYGATRQNLGKSRRPDDTYDGNSDRSSLGTELGFNWIRDEEKRLQNRDNENGRDNIGGVRFTSPDIGKTRQNENANRKQFRTTAYPVKERRGQENLLQGSLSEYYTGDAVSRTRNDRENQGGLKDTRQDLRQTRGPGDNEDIYRRTGRDGQAGVGYTRQQNDYGKTRRDDQAGFGNTRQQNDYGRTGRDNSDGLGNTRYTDYGRTNREDQDEYGYTRQNVGYTSINHGNIYDNKGNYRATGYPGRTNGASRMDMSRTRGETGANTYDNRGYNTDDISETSRRSDNKWVNMAAGGTIGNWFGMFSQVGISNLFILHIPVKTWGINIVYPAKKNNITRQSATCTT